MGWLIVGLVVGFAAGVKVMSNFIKGRRNEGSLTKR